MNQYPTNILSILVLSLSISGCELLGPQMHRKLPLENRQTTKSFTDNKIVYQQLSNENAQTDLSKQSKTELYPGSGKFVGHSSPSQKSKPLNKGIYSLNFDHADLAEVTKVILGDMLNENYLLSPKVKGNVTLQTSHPLTKDALIPTLNLLLQMNRAVLINNNGFYQIKPQSEIANSQVFSRYQKQHAEGNRIQVIPIKNIAVQQIADIIKPLVRDKTILQVDDSRNILLVTGSNAEIERVIEIVNTFDIDIMKGKSFGLFPIKNVAAKKIITELEQVFNTKTNNQQKGIIRLIEIERLNAVLAITHQVSQLTHIEQWISRLDKANTTTGGGVTVYRVQHVDATKLATTLNKIFNQNKRRQSQPSIAAGRKTLTVSNKKPTKKTPFNLNNLVKSSAVTDIGKVKIIADEVNNAIIIVATAQDFAVIHEVIKQLDVMPLQVLIDATIVDVTLTNNLKYGIKWFLTHNSGGQNAISSNGSVLTDIATAAATASTGGLGYAFLANSGSINAVLNAEAAKQNINIISSPSLMVLNNQEATIQVGQERSLRTSASTNTSGGATNSVVTSTVQQRKTGVKVTVKPRVNANGLVIMEIKQSVEDFSDSATNGNPDILTREIKSNVAVQSGETVVLGGLISEKMTQGNSGIPFLYKIPLIGSLFGSTNKTKRKTELVVLITPRVVKSRLDAKLVTNEFKRKLSGIYQDNITNSDSSLK